MRTIGAPTELSQLLAKYLPEGSTIGFIPTMGALHKGHLELIARSKNENDITVVSIFINPIQFNNPEDLEKYPRTTDRDLELLESYDVDYAFLPEEKDLYPNKPSISIDFGNPASVLEGKFRPGHFDGVGIVVSKLLNIVSPTRAYFGLKDLQQFLLVRKMCEELNFKPQIVGVPTIREKSGLAMSSRNQRLSEEGKKIASNIFKGLTKIEEGIQKREELAPLLKESLNFYNQIPDLEIEYLEAINPSNFESVTSYQHLEELAVCFAGYVEGIRLIDNLYLRLK